MKISVSEYIVRRLYQEGISKVPVFQGGAIIKLIDDIGESKLLNYYCLIKEKILLIFLKL